MSINEYSVILRAVIHLVPMESVSLRSYSDAYPNTRMNVETQIPLELLFIKFHKYYFFFHIIFKQIQDIFSEYLFELELDVLLYYNYWYSVQRMI